MASLWLNRQPQKKNDVPDVLRQAIKYKIDQQRKSGVGEISLKDLANWEEDEEKKKLLPNLQKTVIPTTPINPKSIFGTKWQTRLNLAIHAT